MERRENGIEVTIAQIGPVRKGRSSLGLRLWFRLVCGSWLRLD
jgi:hypothetical protein